MVLCAVAVANTYPVTRGTDYVRNAENTEDISRFHCAYPAKNAIERRTKRDDKALMQGFDSHFVAVTVGSGYQVCGRGNVMTLVILHLIFVSFVL